MKTKYTERRHLIGHCLLHYVHAFFKKSCYKSVTLVGHNFSIGVHFEGDGLTYPQIASAYGDVISNLFVEDVGVVNQTLYKLSDFILNK